MKKRVLPLVLSLLIILPSLCSCKKDNESDAGENKFDYNRLGGMITNLTYDYDSFDGFVTLGNFEGKELSYDYYQATEEDVDLKVETILAGYTKQEIAERPAENGDKVIYDFVGELVGGGKLFQDDGSNAQEVVGAGNTLPEIDAVFVGMSAGESRTVRVTFPDPYEMDPENAGREADYTITVTAVYDYDRPELTDEFAAGLGYAGVDTVAKLREQLKATLDYTKWLETRNSRTSAILDIITGLADVKEYPEREHKYYFDYFVQSTKDDAASLGLDFNEVISDKYETEEKFEEEMTKLAEKNMRQDLAVLAVMEKYEITVTEEDIKKEIEYAIATGGLRAASVDEFLASSPDETSLTNYRNRFVCSKIASMFEETF